MITFFGEFPFKLIATIFPLVQNLVNWFVSHRFTRFYMKAKVMASKLKKNPPKRLSSFFRNHYFILKKFGCQKFLGLQPKKLRNFAKFSSIIQTQNVKIMDFIFATYYRYIWNLPLSFVMLYARKDIKYCVTKLIFDFKMCDWIFIRNFGVISFSIFVLTHSFPMHPFSNPWKL